MKFSISLCEEERDEDFFLRWEVLLDLYWVRKSYMNVVVRMQQAR